MFIGKLLAQLMMEEGYRITYFPSYGAEVRGGTANCHIIISTNEIYSPVVEEADSLIIMNQPSYRKFVGRLKEGGIAFLNSSMVEAEEHSNRRFILVPATDIASELGDVRVGNVVMLGVYNAVRGFLPDEKVLQYLGKVLAGRKAELLPLNEKAYRRGKEIGREKLSIA